MTEKEPDKRTSEPDTDKRREYPPYLRPVRMPLAHPYPDDTLTPAGEAAVERLLSALRDIRRTK